MPINFNITREDMLRSKTVKPGMYLLSVKSVTKGPGKNDPSSETITINFVVEDGDKEFIGVPIPYWVSEKAPGLAVDFLEAVSGKKMSADGGSFDIEQCVGRKVKAFIKNEKYQNRMTNKIEGFMPA